MEQNKQAPKTEGRRKMHTVFKMTAALVVLVVIVVLAFTCIRAVPTGYTGILTTFGRVEKSNLGAGMQIKMPWQNIVLMDNRLQKASVDTQAFSSDIQQVDVRLTLNYEIDKDAAATLYEEVGTQYYDKLIAPQLLENTKAVFADYTAEGLIEKRDELATRIRDLMATYVTDHGIVIKGVAIENIDFSDIFTDAIEAKQVATQEYQRAETQQQQTTMEASAQAERQRIAAEAEAEVARIAADAEAYTVTAKAQAEAEANRQVAASLTEALIDYVEAQNWNGELPQTYVGSEDALPVLNMDAATGATD